MGLRVNGSVRHGNRQSSTGPPVTVNIEGRHNHVHGGAVSSPRERVSRCRLPNTPFSLVRTSTTTSLPHYSEYDRREAVEGSGEVGSPSVLSDLRGPTLLGPLTPDVVLVSGRSTPPSDSKSLLVSGASTVRTPVIFAVILRKEVRDVLCGLSTPSQGGPESRPSSVGAVPE